jgi:hypothetical protein
MISIVRGNDERKYLTNIIDEKISNNDIDALVPTVFFNLTNKYNEQFEIDNSIITIYIYDCVQLNEDRTLLPGISILIQSSKKDLFDDKTVIEVKSNNKTINYYLHPLNDYSFSVVSDSTYKAQYIAYDLFTYNGSLDKLVQINIIDFPISFYLSYLDNDNALLSSINDYYTANDSYPTSNYNNIGVVPTFNLKISMVNTFVYGGFYIFAVILGFVGILLWKNKRGSHKPTKNLKKDIDNIINKTKE